MIHHTSIPSVIESYGVENDWRLLISYRTGKYFLLQISKSSNDRGGRSRVRSCNFARGFNDRTLIGLVAEDLNLNKGLMFISSVAWIALRRTHSGSSKSLSGLLWPQSSFFAPFSDTSEWQTHESADSLDQLFGFNINNGWLDCYNISDGWSLKSNNPIIFVSQMLHFALSEVINSSYKNELGKRKTMQ